MLMKKWEELPEEMRTPEVRKYYDILQKKKGSLLLKRGFDITVSRAVARLNLLSELCLPFVKEGGLFLAMKAGDSEEEINEAKTAIKTLGGKIEKVVEYEQEGITRCVVIIRKIAATPKGYPRAFAKIKKNPL